MGGLESSGGGDSNRFFWSRKCLPGRNLLGEEEGSGGGKGNLQGYVL